MLITKITRFPLHFLQKERFIEEEKRKDPVLVIA
jgi:hypothetical protein